MLRFCSPNWTPTWRFGWMSGGAQERNVFICKNLFVFIPLCCWHGNRGAATSEPELELSESAGREEQHFRGALVWIVLSFSGEFKHFHQSPSFSLAFLLLIFCCSSGSASVISRKPQKSNFCVQLRTIVVLYHQFWHLWDMVRMCARWQRLWTQTSVHKFYLRAEFLFQLLFWLEIYICASFPFTPQLFQQLTAIKEDFSRQEKNTEKEQLYSTQHILPQESRVAKTPRQLKDMREMCSVSIAALPARVPLMIVCH